MGILIFITPPQIQRVVKLKSICTLICRCFVRKLLPLDSNSGSPNKFQKCFLCAWNTGIPEKLPQYRETKAQQAPNGGKTSTTT